MEANYSECHTQTTLIGIQQFTPGTSPSRQPCHGNCPHAATSGLLCAVQAAAHPAAHPPGKGKGKGKGKGSPPCSPPSWHGYGEWSALPSQAGSAQPSPS